MGGVPADQPAAETSRSGAHPRSHSHSWCATPAVGASRSECARRAGPFRGCQSSNSTSGGCGVTDLLGAVLVLSMIVFMAARAAPVIAARVEGQVQLEVPLQLVFRVLDMRTNIIATLAVLILGSGVVGERWISHELFLLALVLMIGIVSIPRRYRFTTSGVSPNRATFRAWSEFQAWRISGNVITLAGKERFSSLKLYVAGTDPDRLGQVRRRYPPPHAPQRP